MKIFNRQLTKSNTKSGEFVSATWAKQAVTVTGNIALSPDGRMTASRVAETVDNTYHYIKKLGGVMNTNEVWLITSILKPMGTTQWIYFDVSSNISACYAIVNIVTGQIGLMGSNIRNARVKLLDNGWAEVIIEVIPPNNASTEYYTIISFAGNTIAPHAGSTSNGFYIWKSECKQGILHDNTSPNSETSLLSESFESTNPFTSFTVESNAGGITRSTSRATHGVASMKSTINKADVGYGGAGHPHRAEVQSPVSEFQFGQDYWIGFNCYLENWATDVDAESIWQWHNVPNFSSGETWGTLKIQTPFGLQVVNNQMYVVHSIMPSGQETNPNATPIVTRTNVGTVQNNSWVGWVIHCRWHHTTGHVRVWKDGVLVYEKVGHTYYNDETGPYHKIGIYKWAWAIDPLTSLVSTRTAYFDNWKIVKGTGTSYSDVDPTL